MKRLIPLFVVLSLFAGILGYGGYLLVSFFGSYEPKEKDLDRYLSAWETDISIELLKKLGYFPEIKLFNYNRDDFSCIVKIKPETIEIAALREWVKEGRRCIIFYADDYDSPQLLRVYPGRQFTAEVNDLFCATDRPLDYEIMQTSRNAVTPIAYYKQHQYIAYERVHGGEIIHIANTSLITDKNILKSDNALFFNNLVKDYYNQIIVIEQIHQTSTEKWESEESDFFLFNGMFLLLLWQIIILAFVFIIINRKRFGPIVDREKYLQRSLIHHLEATGDFYEKTGKSFIVKDILDQFFYSRLRRLLRTHSTDTTELHSMVKQRFQNVAGKLFSTLVKRKNLEKQDTEREHLIKKLKGVEASSWQKQKHQKTSRASTKN
ncbi:MAG: hypothetical protein JW904_15055 [Spirochaetales bacterium]|nr:hypothetical protein [Spirochaetales bacterium]